MRYEVLEAQDSLGNIIKDKWQIVNPETGENFNEKIYDTPEEAERDRPKSERGGKTCAYVNDDDGSDSAWCVQDFQKCDEERKEKCSCFKEIS